LGIIERESHFVIDIVAQIRRIGDAVGFGIYKVAVIIALGSANR
jgi:hypothetical protein